MDKEGWQEQAYAHLRGWAKNCYKARVRNPKLSPWTVERMRGWATLLCLVEPPKDERWWGPVVQRALREKIIRRKGFAPAKSSHGALKARYVGTRFA